MFSWFKRKKKVTASKVTDDGRTEVTKTYDIEKSGILSKETTVLNNLVKTDSIPTWNPNSLSDIRISEYVEHAVERNATEMTATMEECGNLANATVQIKIIFPDQDTLNKAKTLIEEYRANVSDN